MFLNLTKLLAERLTDNAFFTGGRHMPWRKNGAVFTWQSTPPLQVSRPVSPLVGVASVDKTSPDSYKAVVAGTHRRRIKYAARTGSENSFNWMLSRPGVGHHTLPLMSMNQYVHITFSKPTKISDNLASTQTISKILPTMLGG